MGGNTYPTTPGGRPYTDEEMADMPMESCEDCGTSIDSFPTDGNVITMPEGDRLCAPCQLDKYNVRVMKEDGTTERSMLG